MIDLSKYASPCPCCNGTKIYVGVAHAFGYATNCMTCGLRTKSFDLPGRSSKKNLEGRLLWRSLKAWNQRPLVRAPRRRHADRFMTRERWDIMEHTTRRAPGGNYCGGGKDMDALVGAGLMASVGDFLGNPYFRITGLGMKVKAMKRFQHFRK